MWLFIRIQFTVYRVRLKIIVALSANNSRRVQFDGENVLIVRLRTDCSAAKRSEAQACRLLVAAGKRPTTGESQAMTATGSRRHATVVGTEVTRTTTTIAAETASRTMTVSRVGRTMTSGIETRSMTTETDLLLTRAEATGPGTTVMTATAAATVATAAAAAMAGGTTTMEEIRPPVETLATETGARQTSLSIARRAWLRLRGACRRGRRWRGAPARPPHPLISAEAGCPMGRKWKEHRLYG